MKVNVHNLFLDMMEQYGNVRADMRDEANSREIERVKRIDAEEKVRKLESDNAILREDLARLNAKPIGIDPAQVQVLCGAFGNKIDAIKMARKLLGSSFGGLKEVKDLVELGVRNGAENTNKVLVDGYYWTKDPIRGDW